MITGSSVSNVAGQQLLVDDFNLTSYKNGDAKQTNVIAQARNAMSMWPTTSPGIPAR